MGPPPDGFTWDQATLVATDEFWQLVNPTRQDMLVEIRPPAHVLLWPRRAPTGAATPAAGGAAVSVAVAVDAEPATTQAADQPEPSRTPEEAWQMLMDRMKMEWMEWVRP